jgi:hypothetical protein
MDVKVSVKEKEMLVDVEAGSGEDETGTCPEPHASVARISTVMKRRSLFFIS